MTEETENNENEEPKELTPEEQKQQEMRQAVRFFYDFQKLRIQSSNRGGTDQVTLSRSHLDTLAIQAFLLETLETKALKNVKVMLKDWPIYKKTACFGHFGRKDPDFTWEKTDMAEVLRKEAGL